MLEQFEIVAKAVADASRVRILKMLEGGELCVCRIQIVLGLAPATVSKHLATLRLAGLVMSKKRGRWVYYRLADQAFNPYARPVLELTVRALEGDPAVSGDRAKLALLSEIPAERLCDEGPEVLREAERHEGATELRYKAPESARS